MELLVYGSYGYTGEIVVEEAVEQGLDPVVGGRDSEKLERQAEEHNLTHHCFTVDEMKSELEGYDVLLNCAGPFSRTYRDAVEACLEHEVDYLDLTGEVDVFRGIESRDAEARVADVSLLPGAGFDVVPSDCLASYVADNVDSVSQLAVGFETILSPSGGTAKTAVEGLGRGCFVREDGELRRVPTASRRRTIDFGAGDTNAALFPLGDVVTAHHSTGAPDIETYVGLSPTLARMVRVAESLGPLTRSRAVQKALKAAAEAAFTGPDEEERREGEAHIWAEAVDEGSGEHVEAQLRTPETYAFTASAAVEAASRVRDVEPGFQTPATAFGDDFVLEFDGVERTDV